MEYNDKQNQSTRIEFLVAINYLLDECFDKEHCSKTIRLTEYAQEKFGLFIDRRRVNPILSQLYELSHSEKNAKSIKLPFVINKIGCRYYIEKRIMREKDLLYIVTSIKKDETISDKETDRIINKILDVCCTKSQKATIQTKAKQYITPSKKLSNKVVETYEYLRDCISQKLILHYRFVDYTDIHCSANHIVMYREGLTKALQNNDILLSRVYAIAPHINKKSDIVILHMEWKNHRIAISTKIENIIIVENATESWATKENLSIDGYDSIDDWFDELYKGKSGFVHNIKFKFWFKYYEEVKKAYCEFFKMEDMPYEVIDRQVKLHNEEEATTQDYVCSIECNYRSFRKWYFDNNLFNYLVVLEPAYLNDDLLGDLVERFAKRLTKYGARYNYELNKTIKPEEEARIRAFHDKIKSLNQKRIKPLDKSKDNK